MDIKILMGLVKREVRDEVEFSQVDKHQSFLPFDFKTFSIKVSCKVILSFIKQAFSK